jgi:hypothetical protein
MRSIRKASQSAAHSDEPLSRPAGLYPPPPRTLGAADHLSVPLKSWAG